MNDDLKQQQVARINLYALISRLTMSEVDEGLLTSIEEDENMLSFFQHIKAGINEKNMIEKS